MVCCLQFIANLCTLPILAYYGRKPLTIFGNLTLGIEAVLLGIFLIFSHWGPSTYIILVLLLMYFVVFGVFSPVIYLYIPEIIPAKIVPFATATNFFGASIAIIFTPMII